MNLHHVFPRELDGAKVLFHTPRGNYGASRYTNGKIADHYLYFAICKYENDNQYYLFCCGENYQVASDYLIDSIEECKEAAASLYKGSIVWHKVD